MLLMEFNQSSYEELAELFGLLSNPVRLQILDYLMAECCKRTEGSCSVSEIYQDLQLSQPLISKHLKILQTSGILCYTRKGTKILYAFATDNKIRLLQEYFERFSDNGICCCAQQE
jgi:DNA-binding transcriptional ArsR family regulator